MTELQQAAQKALNILDSEFTTLNGEFCRWCDGRLNAKHNCALEQAITALRAAIAKAEVERLQQGKKAIAEYVKEQCPTRESLEGCTHCTHPMYAGIRCGVCGRWTEKTK